MTSLLSRLEALTAPDRKIDAEIALANGWVRTGGDDDYATVWHNMRSGLPLTGPPRYTGSLDAALTLVTEDPANPGKPMLWWLTYDEDGVAGPRAYTAALGKGYHEPNYVYGHNDTSPAIALLIAIMKAKEESGK
jgi:hypothetical protein